MALEEFNMSQVGTNKNIVIIGSTDKTVLVKDYLYYNCDIPFCTCISPSENYTDIIPRKFIFTQYNNEVVNAFYYRQCKNTNTRSRQKYDFDNRSLLLIEDYSPSDNETIHKIFTNGSHVDITAILTTDSIFKLDICKSNIDYVFILDMPNISEQIDIWNNYASMFFDFNTFSNIFKDFTADSGILVIDTNSKLEERVYWYKAKNRTGYRVCHPAFWNDWNEWND